jgi:hypothetical protein
MAHDPHLRSALAARRVRDGSSKVASPKGRFTALKMRKARLLAGGGASAVLAISSIVGCRCVSNRQQGAAAVQGDSGPPVLAAAPGSSAAPAGSGTNTGAPAAPSTTIAQEIFAGGLKNDWQDYGWTDREVQGPGPARLRFANWGGWIIANKNVPGTFGGLIFKMKAPKDFGEFLEIRAESDTAGDFEPVEITQAHITPLDGGWVRVLVPMSQLNPYGQPWDRLRLRGKKRLSNEWVLLDGLGLTVPSKDAPAPRAFPTKDGALTVKCQVPARPISPMIYGVANGKEVEDMGAAARRFGGNPTSRYNWQLGDAWSTGSDYFFRNVKIDLNYKSFIETGLARKQAVAITVPIMGWVAKDRESYSFPVATYGPQKEIDPNRDDIGNGVGSNGKELKPGPPSRTSMQASPEWVAQWVKSIREDDAKRGSRGVASYILDNEPALWNSTHRDVHPEPLGYDELLDRTIRYGAAVRGADPEAVIAGPAEWGWSGYFWSAKDQAAGFTAKPDRRAHGDVPLLNWYLAKLREHEQKTGVRILDVVDLHYYPQGKGIFENGGGGGVDVETAQRRFRATRSLWDPDYVDESWIKEKVRLIPRLKEIIAENYPGRGISIGEWNFGAEGHISGALALAEVLGRFAQGGVTSAYYWTAPKKDSPAYFAFRAYRNFDGRGGRFLDKFVEATAPDRSSLFVSRDDSGKRMVAILINFAHDNGLKAKIDVASCGDVTSRRTFTYTGHPGGFGEGKTTQGGGTTIEESVPPYSITVLDLTLAEKKP